MKIAVCDDDLGFTTRIEAWIADCLGKEQADRSDVYLSGEELLQVIEKENKPYQLYLLDIEMGGITGMELAYEIRRRDVTALIIFLTSHAEKMPEAFEVNAFHYLVKPVEEEKVRQVLRRAASWLNRDKSFFRFQSGRKDCMVECADILYLESRGRKIRIQTDREMQEFYGTLKDALASLRPEGFVQIHQAYLINMHHLEAVERECVTMRGGIELPVSRTFRKSFQKTYQEFVLTEAV